MTLHEGYLVARAVLRVLRDSERTEEIHRVEEITGRGPYRRYLEAVRDQPETALLLRDRPELSSEHVDYQALRRLPVNTLGNRYVRHLDRYELSADSQATVTRYETDPDIAYLMRRFRQTHDVWHTLLDLGIQGHEEVIIHAFSWGQLHLPVSAMVVFFGTLKHIVFERRWLALRRGLAEAYYIGKEAAPLLPVYWERMWEEPIDQVRRRHGLRPCTFEYVHG